MKNENNQGMTKISMYDNFHFKLRLSIFKTGDTEQVIKTVFFKMADIRITTRCLTAGRTEGETVRDSEKNFSVLCFSTQTIGCHPVL